MRSPAMRVPAWVLTKSSSNWAWPPNAAPAKTAPAPCWRSAMPLTRSSPGTIRRRCRRPRPPAPMRKANHGTPVYTRRQPDPRRRLGLVGLSQIARSLRHFWPLALIPMALATRTFYAPRGSFSFSRGCQPQCRDRGVRRGTAYRWPVGLALRPTAPRRADHRARRAAQQLHRPACARSRTTAAPAPATGAQPQHAHAAPRATAPPAPDPAPPPPPPAPPAPRPKAQAPRPAPMPVAMPDPAPAAPDAPIGVVTEQPPAPPMEAPVVTAAPAPPVVPTPPAPPAPPPKIELPSSDAAYLNNPKPAYPAISRRMGEQGKVLLRVLIGSDGLPQKVEINQSSGFDRLDRQAQEAVMRWRFVPGKRNGVAEAMWDLVPVNFVLE